MSARMDKLHNKNFDADSRGSRQTTPSEMYRGGERPNTAGMELVLGSKTQGAKLMQRKDWREAMTLARYPDFNQRTLAVTNPTHQISTSTSESGGNGGSGGYTGGSRSPTSSGGLQITSTTIRTTMTTTTIGPVDLSRQVTPLRMYRDGVRRTTDGELNPVQMKALKALKPAAGHKIGRFHDLAKQRLVKYDKDALMEEYLQKRQGGETLETEDMGVEGGVGAGGVQGRKAYASMEEGVSAKKGGREESEVEEPGEITVEAEMEMDNATSEYRQRVRERDEAQARKRLEKGIEKLKGLVVKKNATTTTTTTVKEPGLQLEEE